MINISKSKTFQVSSSLLSLSHSLLQSYKLGPGHTSMGAPGYYFPNLLIQNTVKILVLSCVWIKVHSKEIISYTP